VCHEEFAAMGGKLRQVRLIDILPLCQLAYASLPAAWVLWVVLLQTPQWVVPSD